MEEPLGQVLQTVTSRLDVAGVDNPRFDARQLIAAVTGLSARSLSLYLDRLVSIAEQEVLETFVRRREAREPVARILGHRGFWTLELALNAVTLDPRPDTETLVEAVLRNIPDPDAPLRILDLGTGSGAILVALLHELPHAYGVGVDLAPAAAAMAFCNAHANGVGDRASFIVGSWAQSLAGTFDVIVSNPPYIPLSDIAALEPEVRLYDPALALVGADDDGLGCYRALIPDAARLLSPGSLLAVEVGIGQADAVAVLFTSHGFSVPTRYSDLGGVERCLASVSGGS